MQHAWVIPALPLLSFALVGLVLRPLNARLAGAVAAAAVALSAALGWWLAFDYLQFAPPAEPLPTLIPWQVEWLRFQDGLRIDAGTLLDPASVLLVVVVTTVSALVHVYSLAYMKGEPGYGRYFAVLNLFTFSMLGLVLAPNLVQMFVCWELVGASSFFLIGFWYDRPAAVAASKKAFVVTRFADLGLLLAILLLGQAAFDVRTQLGASAGDSQALDFAFLGRADVLAALAHQAPVLGGMTALTLGCLLLFVGGAGKSAMFPLHIWLPDAMEGPTPVSALIHAATMVVAGVYLVARAFPLLAAADGVLTVVLAVGTFTALFAAAIGCTQDDLKRVLAFSTLSQLGYMMLALGTCGGGDPAGRSAALFHLFTHAFFKALLFLGAGAVLHAAHTGDVWHLGGLRRKMPLTHALFLLATLAIAGIWPLSGFFSKDEVLAAALHGGHPLVFAVGLGVAGLTAFYMARVYLLVFWGEPRREASAHVHEAPLTMVLPMGALAVLAAVAGFVPVSRWVALPGTAEHAGIDWLVAGPATAAALAGFGAAGWLYGGDLGRSDAAVARLGRLYGALRHKFWIDELYLWVARKVMFRLVAAPIAWFDRMVVDGTMHGVGLLTRLCGAGVQAAQTGQAQAYAAWALAGGLAVVGLLWAAGRAG
ncbi:MAG: NADH-quinone oxidoreductase subunit L [Deltaproteobacteria bacterium]|nr:NADH-quinone oxidoreductase subunit L [Deltaproteobacteria bacterium]